MHFVSRYVIFVVVFLYGVIEYLKRNKLIYCILVCTMYDLQLKELNSRGYEVILVASGAVGVGRQRLRYRRLVNSRFIFLIIVLQCF